MAHSELPPSSSDKWIECGAWLTTMRQLPERDDSSPAAEEGTLAHHYFEQALLGNQEEFGKTPDAMYQYLVPVVEWVKEQPGILHPESEVDFGDYFGYVGLTGTSDVILEHPDHLTIADLKYGYGVVEVEDNWQLFCYLVGAVRRFGKRERYQMVILQPRPYHSRGVARSLWIDHEEFLRRADILNAAIQNNYRGGKAVVGDHCRKYCKALGSCKAVRDHSLMLLRSTPID